MPRVATYIAVCVLRRKGGKEILIFVFRDLSAILAGQNLRVVTLCVMPLAVVVCCEVTYFMWILWLPSDSVAAHAVRESSYTMFAKYAIFMCLPGIVIVSGCAASSRFVTTSKGLHYYDVLASNPRGVPAWEQETTLWGEPARRLGFSPDGKRWVTITVTEEELARVAKANPELVKEAEAYQHGFHHGRISGMKIGLQEVMAGVVYCENQCDHVPDPPPEFADYREVWANGWREGFPGGYSYYRYRVFPYRPPDRRRKDCPSRIE